MKLNKRNLVIFSFTLLFSVAVIGIYANFSPTENDMWFPQCPFKMLTGLNCPGCGIQRAIHAFLNGNCSKALAYNYFFVVSIPYFIILCIAYLLRKSHKLECLSNLFEHRFFAKIYVCCFFAWFIIRNVFAI